MRLVKRKRKRRFFSKFLLLVVILLALPGASVYYVGSGGESCARCHEIQPSYETWQVSTHRNVSCKTCHGSPLTLDIGFHTTNLHRLVDHLRGSSRRQPQIKQSDLWPLIDLCRTCHQQEFADWQAGPHSATYATIFLDETHNAEELLTDDCLRCHGMHFEGSIRDLVSPISMQGPWRLIPSHLLDKPTIPCMSCHEIHREGKISSEQAASAEVSGASGQAFRPSVALFDRRSLMHISTARLPIPQVRDGEREVRVSPDVRQGICYQCHAPVSSFQVASGDDRTCVGVHEGISCLACHRGHLQQARSSCADCHPRWSNCGLDVETMDTTFRSPDSPNNIHFVRCIDCHPQGTPGREEEKVPVG